MKKAIFLLLVFMVFFTTLAFTEASDDTAIMIKDSYERSKFSVTGLDEALEDLGDIALPPTVYAPTSFWKGTTGARIDILDEEAGIFFEIKRYTLNDEGLLILDNEFSPTVEGIINARIPDPSGAKHENGYPKTIYKEINGSEMGEYDVQYFIPTVDTSYILNKDGYYFISYRIEGLEGGTFTMIKLEDNKSDMTEVKDDSIEKVKAIPTNSKILVNGAEENFEAYLINANNYFKLRDIAMAVNNTNKNFEITWDADKQVINLIPETSYTAVGGELLPGDAMEKTGTKTEAGVHKNGVAIDLLGYNINGNNFFKLRDVAKVFDIGIKWDGETKTVEVDTSTGYVE